MSQTADALTGLWNNLASQQALESALADARRYGGAVSIFLLDIDHFKEINDEHGREAGDAVLKRLAHILEANFAGKAGRIKGPETPLEDVRAMGVVGRVAGDEFLVIMPGQPADSAFILADEVRRLIEDSDVPVTKDGRETTIRFHISGGIATSPTDAAQPVDLMRKADEALYRSKQIGRNRISLPTPAQMITKTSYYTQIQLERLAAQARKLDKTEAFLLREALDELLRKYEEE